MSTIRMSRRQVRRSSLFGRCSVARTTRWLVGVRLLDLRSSRCHQERSSNGRVVRAAETVAQDWRAWDLRCQHLTYREIGAELGLDPSSAYHGLDAPTQRAVDLITHDMFIQAIGDLDAEVDRMEAEVGRQESEGDELEAGELD